MKRLAVRGLVLVGLLGSAGCPKRGVGGGTGGFRVFYPDATGRGLIAQVGTRIQAKPAADCRNSEGAEARWANTGARVIRGELPPGLVVEDGAIAGVPTARGSYRVTLEFTGVTCAAAPVDDQTVDVAITVR